MATSGGFSPNDDYEVICYANDAAGTITRGWMRWSREASAANDFEILDALGNQVNVSPVFFRLVDCSPSIDREAFCYRTRTETTTGTPPNEVTTVTLGGDIETGWVRHDDTLPPPGIAYFDEDGQPLTAGSFEPVPCIEPCCAEVLGEGCWDDGTDSGTWVSVRDSDGTVTVTDPATGDPVDADDIVACTPTTYRTEVRTVDGGTNFTIPGAGTNLVSWSVRARIGNPELNVSGVTTVLDQDETIESAAQRDDGAVLEDVPVITSGAGESARVVYMLRTEA